MKKLINHLAILLAAVSLIACGGGSGGASATGGSGSDSNQSAEGLWLGTSSTGWNMNGIILDNGDYYVLYGDTYVAGVVVGASSVKGNTFTSLNATDFNLLGNGVLPASISGVVSTKNSLSGKINYGSEEVTFTSSYSSDYDATPSLTSLSGNYSGEVAFALGNELANLSISQNGEVQGVGSSGCSVTGSAYPRAKGNVFNLILTFGGSPCYFENQTLEGIIYYDQSIEFVYAIAHYSNRSDGVLFLGGKN